MILFVFEGEDREPNIYKTIEKLFFPRQNENIVCSFGNNLYALYKEMIDLDGDGDIVSVLKTKLGERGDTMLQELRSSDFSEIFLFFDYDFQHSQLSLDEINQRVDEMLTLFNEETENGKLYINYPMVESIRYTKELPDENYVDYIVSREECNNFKQLAKEFSYYNDFTHILFRDNEIPSKQRYLTIQDNWSFLRHMNVCKANWIVNGRNEIPINKEDINQIAIFEGQKQRFVETHESVAILNSFPLFIFDYFK